MSNVEEWLDHEDKCCRDNRLERLKWTMKEYPKIEIPLFRDGLKSYYLFEEARYCFVYGQYTASIMLSLSFIETTLASMFYASGRNDLERARLSDLLKEAKEKGLISEQEFIVFDKVRKLRNPLTHFRKPSDRENVEYRALEKDAHPYDLLEEDAKMALKANFRIMEKFSVRKNGD
jgi:hypothetical protein